MTDLEKIRPSQKQRLDRRKFCQMDQPDVDEFKKFHRLLMEGAPDGYEPHYVWLKEGEKVPIEGRHWKQSPLPYSDAVSALKNGFNVGIAGTYSDSLTCVDIDDPDAVDWMKPTLIVVSKSRVGHHAFYFGDGENVDEGRGEIRTDNYYVVCPGSYVPPKEDDDHTSPLRGFYTVEREKSPSWIADGEFPSFLQEQMDLIDEWSHHPQDNDVSVSSKYGMRMYIEEWGEALERADEWNDGRYWTIRQYLIPRLYGMGMSEDQVREKILQWLEKNGRGWMSKYENAFIGQPLRPTSTTKVNGKAFGPDHLTDWYEESSL